jgi:hypothetical protein
MQRPSWTRVSVVSVTVIASVLFATQNPAHAVTDPIDVTGYSCFAYRLCVYEHADFGGKGLAFYYCGDRYMADYGMAGKISSLINTQTTGTTSSFSESGSVYLLMTDTARSYRRNLTYDAALGGGNVNDRIDVITVC